MSYRIGLESGNDLKVNQKDHFMLDKQIAKESKRGKTGRKKGNKDCKRVNEEKKNGQKKEKQN